MLSWRMRNAKGLNYSIEELGALVDRATLMEMYRMATADKHGSLYVNLLNETDQMFYKGFDQRFVVS